MGTQLQLGPPAQMDRPRRVRVSELMNPSGRQREALQAIRRAKFVLYGGAAGGGKSYWLRWALLIFLLRAYGEYGVPNVRVGLFCEDYPALKDRQLSKIAREFPRWLGELKDTREEGPGFYLRQEFGGGFIALRNLDKPEKYDSVEFAAMGVDELTKNREEIFHELRKRLRWPNYQVQFDFDPDRNPVPSERRGFPKDFIFPFFGGTNPGGIGHAWVKRFWIDQDLPPELLSEYGKDQFAFIKSLAMDNPHNPGSYYRDLLSLPEPLRSAYARGDWNLFSGQYFKEWRRELHVCRAFPIPSYWRQFWSGDWGFAKPFFGGTWAVSPEGDVYLTAEQVWTLKSNDWMGRELCRIHQNRNIAYRKLDPSCWDDSRGLSNADQLKAGGWVCEKASNDRIAGWMRVREYLAWEQSDAGVLIRRPKLQVFDTCTETIRTLPALVFDKRNVEDLDTDGEDHAGDMVRYGLMSQPGVSKIPIEELPVEYAEALLRANKEESGMTRSTWVS